jgi:cytochrome c peroxidase
MKHIKHPLRFLTAIASCTIALSILIAPSCRKSIDDQVEVRSEIAPKLPAQPFSYEGSQLNNNDLVTLGRVLFYERNLSLNSSTSCGSCHQQKFGFADNKQFSPGLYNLNGARNTSSLIQNSTSFAPFSERPLFWDGRAETTIGAVFMPITNSREMHMYNVEELPNRLSKLSYYPQLFTNAFGTPEITVTRIREAVAAFLGAMVTLDNRTRNSGSLTAFENEGAILFTGKARCYTCHNGNEFNGYDVSYENIGLNVSYSDLGRYGITGLAKDRGRFKVPSLINIAQSAPYMHDGRFATLRQVIDHYDHGIQNSVNLSPWLRDIDFAVFFQQNPNVDINTYDFSAYAPIQLNLTEREKDRLESYLNAMSDQVLLNHPKFSDPF